MKHTVETQRTDHSGDAPLFRTRCSCGWRFESGSIAELFRAEADHFELPDPFLPRL